MTLKAMIIDDEPFVRKDLRHMLLAHEEIEVICEAGTIAAAKKQLSKNNLDVVFLDIQLRGGTGFDLVPFIDPSLNIIFITAHDEYAIRAFDVNALDYILKPVTTDRLAQSIMRLTPGMNVPKAEPGQQRPFKPDDRVFIHSNSIQMFVVLEEITTITSIGGNYGVVHLKNGEKLTCRKTFKEWENLLPDSVFMRIHRATIINLECIERINYEKTGSCRVYLSGKKQPAAVSRRMVPRLKCQVKKILPIRCPQRMTCSPCQ